ncbi:hypothetical protein [Reinekea sp.]|jgi:hypothetical protein
MSELLIIQELMSTGADGALIVIAYAIYQLDKRVSRLENKA